MKYIYITEPIFYSKSEFDRVINDLSKLPINDTIMVKIWQIYDTEIVTNKMIMDTYYAHPYTHNYLPDFNIHDKPYVQYCKDMVKICGVNIREPK
jgi:hypothetical protein